jgi:hypothetical protein
MNLRLTRSQILTLLVGVALVLVLALVPRHGPPAFRYTGSDSETHVWNLGWPFATCIIDAAYVPHIFFGPFAFLFAVVGFSGLFLAYTSFVLWHNLGFVKSRAKRQNSSVSNSI